MNIHKLSNKVILVLPTLIVLLFLGSTYGAIMISRQINFSGTIVTDNNLSVSASNFDLGTLKAGDTLTRAVTITNNANTPLVLSMATSILPQGVTLTWDGAGVTLIANQFKTVTFTLTTAANATTGPFNLAITISGTSTT